MFQRQAHFIWMTNQDIDGKVLQENELFGKWLVAYFQDWGSFLDTPESFSPKILECYISKFPEWRVQVSVMVEQIC